MTHIIPITWTRWVGAPGWAPTGDTLVLMTRGGEYCVDWITVDEDRTVSHSLWDLAGDDHVESVDGWSPATEAPAHVLDAVVAGWEYPLDFNGDGEACWLERQ